jgi:microcystin-dependent protein
MSSPYVGEIRMVGFNFAPVGWELCNGQLLDISEYSTLFELIGTTYGGDGKTTYALPNLQGRVPIHQGSDFEIGELAGSETVTLDLAEIPAHSHQLNAQTGAGNQQTPADGVWASSALKQFSTGSPTTSMDAVLQPSGGDQPHNNMPAFQCTSFIISLFGIFPSQG